MAQAQTATGFSGSNIWCERRGRSLYFEGHQIAVYNGVEDADYQLNQILRGSNSHSVCGAPKGTRCWIRVNHPGDFDVLWDSNTVIYHAANFFDIAYYLERGIGGGNCLIRNTNRCELRGLEIFADGESVGTYSTLSDAAYSFQQLKNRGYCQ